MSPRPVTVLLADDHPLFRDAMQEMVLATDGLMLAGVTGDGREALKMISELDPDVAVLDVRMPGLDGPALARRLSSSGARTRVLFLSAHGEGAIIYAAVAAGAAGYLSKESSGKDICAAIRTVAGGSAVLAPELNAALFQQIQGRAVQDTPHLSEREHQVLTLAAEGCSVAEMGRRLYLSPGTIKTHLAHLYGKLGVSDRGAAVAEAMRRGLLA